MNTRTKQKLGEVARKRSWWRSGDLPMREEMARMAWSGGGDDGEEDAATEDGDGKVRLQSSYSACTRDGVDVAGGRVGMPHPIEADDDLDVPLSHSSSSLPSLLLPSSSSPSSRGRRRGAAPPRRAVSRREGSGGAWRIVSSLPARGLGCCSWAVVGPIWALIVLLLVSTSGLCV